MEMAQDHDPTTFPPFAVTVDVVIMTVQPPTVEVLLITRDAEPANGLLTLPGGFVAIDEGLVEAAQRKLHHKTGLDIDHAHLEQLATFGDPQRDSRMRTVSVAYLAMVPHRPEPIDGGVWRDVFSLGNHELGFDHHQIIQAGLERAKSKLEYTTLATTFCSPEFTMGELRDVYSTVWGQSLDPGNFHRKVLATKGFVEDTGQLQPQPKGRPARTYTAGEASRLRPPLERLTTDAK